MRCESDVRLFMLGWRTWTMGAGSGRRPGRCERAGLGRTRLVDQFGQPLDEAGRPRFEVRSAGEQLAQRRGRGEVAAQHVRLADGDRSARAGDLHQAEVDRADGVGVVVEQADAAPGELALEHQLLAQLAPRAAVEHRCAVALDVARIDVSSNADRELVVQALLSAAREPSQQQHLQLLARTSRYGGAARAARDDRVGDDLLELGVALRALALDEEALLAHGALELAHGPLVREGPEALRSRVG